MVSVLQVESADEQRHCDVGWNVCGGERGVRGGEVTVSKELLGNVERK